MKLVLMSQNSCLECEGALCKDREEKSDLNYSIPFWGSFWSILGGLFINVLIGHISNIASTVQ